MPHGTTSSRRVPGASTTSYCECVMRDDRGRRAVGLRFVMSMDRQPVLVGDLLELRPLRPDDFDALFRVAADPLIWEQHPERERYQERTFRVFFNDAIDSGGALAAID